MSSIGCRISRIGWRMSRIGCRRRVYVYSLYMYPVSAKETYTSASK
jgi:hypothetical protein